MRNVEAKLVQIGNSRGIRIPKVILEQAGIGSETEVDVEMAVVEDSIVIRRPKKARRGWEAACGAMAEKGEDALLSGDVWPATDFDREQWEW